MKIDTDNLSEITIYGISNADMIDIAGLPDNIETWQEKYNNKYFYFNDQKECGIQLYVSKIFIEKTISLYDSENEIIQNDFENNYFSYTCYFKENKMEVVTDTNIKPIPQDVADRVVLFCLFYGLKFETKKAS